MPVLVCENLEIREVGENFHGVQGNAAVHRVKQFSGFPAVLDYGVVLSVSPEADAPAQIRGGGEVVDPGGVDLLEQHPAFHVSGDDRAEFGDAVFVKGLEPVEESPL